MIHGLFTAIPLTIIYIYMQLREAISYIMNIIVNI